MWRRGQESSMFLKIVLILFVIAAGLTIAILIFEAVGGIDFCAWWEQFFPRIPILGDRALACPWN